MCNLFPFRSFLISNMCVYALFFNFDLFVISYYNYIILEKYCLITDLFNMGLQQTLFAKKYLTKLLTENIILSSFQSKYF